MSWFKSTVHSLMGADESLQYQNSSDTAQAVTVGATDTAVTLTNPHTVENTATSAKTIYIKLAQDTTFAAYYFTAGQVKRMRASSIGGTVTGTDSGTTVVVRGVK